MSQTWLAIGLLIACLIAQLAATAAFRAKSLNAFGLIFTPFIAGGYMIGLLLLIYAVL